MTYSPPTHFWLSRKDEAKLTAYGYDHDDGKFYWFVDANDELRSCGVCKSRVSAVNKAMFEIRRIIALRAINFEHFKRGKAK